MRGRSLSEMVHLPSRRQTRDILGAGLLAAVICWYFGVDVWHAILLGCAITVIALALLVAASAPDALDLSWRPGNRPSREGSRRDVASLSASLRSGRGFVGLTAERRLHEIARRRLALEGLDLQNPEHQLEIERRLGSSAYRAVQGRHGRPSLRRLLVCLDALDATDSTHYPAPQSSARRWDLLPTIPFSLRRARERR